MTALTIQTGTLRVLVASASPLAARSLRLAINVLSGEEKE